MEPGEQDAVLGGQDLIPVDAAVLGGLIGLQRQYEQGQWFQWGILSAEAILHYGLAGVSWLAEILNWHNADQVEQVLEQSKSIGKQMRLQQDETVKVDEQGQIIERISVQNLVIKEDLGKDIALEVMVIPGGIFLMGAPESEVETYANEKPQHQVMVESFWLGKHPVTQAQWRIVAGWTKVKRDLEPDPSHFKGDQRPVEQVSCHEAVEFCDRLTAHTGRSYQLPTEAEWEYACRAGTTTPFHFGETITTELANFDGAHTYGLGSKGEYREQTTEVGRFPPNAFGLYDLHGNVREWCADDWHTNYVDKPDELKKSGNLPWKSTETLIETVIRRSLRGGSWYVYPRNCRSAFRNHYDPGICDLSIGFRVVCHSKRN